MTRYVPKACIKHGHGPASRIQKRIWWKPWRWRVFWVCWVCDTEMTPAQVEAANKKWSQVDG